MQLELMEFLYRVMEELSNAGVPIVFKGAMVLNLVIRENNPSRVERVTGDRWRLDWCISNYGRNGNSAEKRS